MPRGFAACALACGALLAAAETYYGNLPLNHPAIRYSDAPTEDRVARLAGRMKLKRRADSTGYLASLLENLDINVDSQALVFSKTSFQAEKVSPRNPRAIYFSDDVAVGFVPGGHGAEIAALDPTQGVIFYTLDETGEIHRNTVCLQCHQGPATLGVPGIFIGSVLPNAEGKPSPAAAIVTDDRTPFADRWGGWFVNAAHGEQPDRANVVATNPAAPKTLDFRVAPPADPSRYLSPTSDIVALMTFEHQTRITNLLTRLGWDARIGATRAATDLEIDEAVQYMLLTDEAPLKEPVAGVSSFTRTFPRGGPRDREGRSLRDFDLQTRLFRYRLSYMIYSPVFDRLPDETRERFYRRLSEALNSLPENQKRAVFEILEDTKTNIPAWWKSQVIELSASQSK